MKKSNITIAVGLILFLIIFGFSTIENLKQSIFIKRNYSQSDISESFHTIVCDGYYQLHLINNYNAKEYICITADSILQNKILWKVVNDTLKVTTKNSEKSDSLAYIFIKYNNLNTVLLKNNVTLIRKKTTKQDSLKLVVDGNSKLIYQ